MQLVATEAAAEGYGHIYPVEFFIELAKLRSFVSFLVAVWEDRIVGGGIFIRDGSSVRYFHGASDRSYSHLFPLAGLLDQAIRWVMSPMRILSTSVVPPE